MKLVSKSYTNMSILDSRTHRHISPSNRDQMDRSDRLPQWCYEVIHKQKPQPMGHPWDPVGLLDTGSPKCMTGMTDEWRILGICQECGEKPSVLHSFFATIDTWYANLKRMNRHPNGHFFTWTFFPTSHRTINFKMFSKIKTTCRNKNQVFGLHFGAIIFTRNCVIFSVSLQHFDNIFISFHFISH